MITHEEAKHVVQVATSGLDMRDKLYDYISQQEKKDKLLELYREHHKVVPFTPGLGDKSKRVIDINIEIKQLEKELGK